MYTSITIFRNFLLKIQYFDGKFWIIGPPKRCGSNSKALSAVKLVMISRKSFNFDLILHKKTTWGVKFVALFKLVRFCLGGFCTSTRTSCQGPLDSLIFWFLPPEKLQIDWLSTLWKSRVCLNVSNWFRHEPSLFFNWNWLTLIDIGVFLWLRLRIFLKSKKKGSKNKLTWDKVRNKVKFTCTLFLFVRGSLKGLL